MAGPRVASHSQLPAAANNSLILDIIDSTAAMPGVTSHHHTEICDGDHLATITCKQWRMTKFQHFDGANNGLWTCGLVVGDCEH